MQFTITSEHAKVRLDKFLTEHFPEMSRAHLQKLVKSGQVTVNGKKITPHHFLKESDEVEAVVEPVAELRVEPNPAVSFAVLHEEPDFIIVNKPAGLVVHQGEGHKTPNTLINGLLARYPEIARVGDDTIRPGIVHRLDADVSGVMVIARTQDMFDLLKRQFKMHTIEKEYVAVVYGAVSPASGVIDFAIARKGAKMVARAKGEEGKTAMTEYETIRPISHLGQIGPMTLLKIKIHTGRTHQIRVHLFALGYPILGDKLYRTKKAVDQRGEVAKRLMLHGRRLAFMDLKRERREFIVEPPIEFTYHISRNT